MHMYFVDKVGANVHVAVFVTEVTDSKSDWLAALFSIELNTGSLKPGFQFQSWDNRYRKLELTATIIVSSGSRVSTLLSKRKVYHQQPQYEV